MLNIKVYFSKCFMCICKDFFFFFCRGLYVVMKLNLLILTNCVYLNVNWEWHIERSHYIGGLVNISLYLSYKIFWGHLCIHHILYLICICKLDIQCLIGIIYLVGFITNNFALKSILSDVILPGTVFLVAVNICLMYHFPSFLSIFS